MEKQPAKYVEGQVDGAEKRTSLRSVHTVCGTSKLGNLNNKEIAVSVNRDYDKIKMLQSGPAWIRIAFYMATLSAILCSGS